MDKKKKIILVIAGSCVLVIFLIKIITDASLTYKRNELKKNYNETMYKLKRTAIENGYYYY